MLAEEDALETGGLGAGPGVEISIEVAQRRGGIAILDQTGWRRKEFEDPRFDHAPVPAVFNAFAKALLNAPRTSMVAMTTEILGHCVRRFYDEDAALFQRNLIVDLDTELLLQGFDIGKARIVARHATFNGLPFAVVDGHGAGDVIGVVLSRVWSAPIPWLAENVGLVGLHVLNRRRRRIAIDVVGILDRQYGVHRDASGDVAGLREAVAQDLAAVSIHHGDPVLVVLTLTVHWRQFGVDPQPVVPIFGVDRFGDADRVVRGRRRPLHLCGAVLLFGGVEDACAGVVGAVHHDRVVTGRQKLQDQRVIIRRDRIRIDTRHLDAVLLAPFLQSIAAVIGAGEFRNRTDQGFGAELAPCVLGAADAALPRSGIDLGDVLGLKALRGNAQPDLEDIVLEVIVGVRNAL